MNACGLSGKPTPFLKCCRWFQPWFRFTLPEILRLVDVLDLPEPLITSKSGYRASHIEALCLPCARLRSPEDLMSLTTKYEWSATAISKIINDTASHIYKAWSHLLQWDHVSTLSPIMLQTYADTLAAFRVPCKNVIRFIDCTICKTCQPKVF